MEGASAVGKKRFVDDKPDQFSYYVHRQPEHVEIAGALGLGEWTRRRSIFGEFACSS
jgi:hypothetical protein